METKTCTSCKQSKLLEEFQKAKGYRDGYKTWCKACCYQRTCVEWRKANPEKARAINNRSAKRENAPAVRKAWRNSVAEETGKAYDHDYMIEWRKRQVEQNPDFFWESFIKGAYKMSREDYEARLAKQNGGCAICGGQNTEHKKLAIDHDHACCPGQKKSCGKCVRGLLCSRCNHMLGHAKDNIKILEYAILYLKQYKKV